MKPSDLLNANREAIQRIVAAHRGLNPRVFGSVARGTDTDSSDLDIVVDRASGMTLFDLAAIQVELQQLLVGIRIDVVTPQALPDQWRDRAIAEAVPV